MKIKTLPFEDLEFSYFGPDLFWGPMPTVFYFSIDAHSSLSVDPFNQAIVPMQNHSMRVFSVDLPEHGAGLDPHTAIERWAAHSVQNKPILEPFLEKLARFIAYLDTENLIDHRLGVMGLSRGALIAAHLAALTPKIKHIIGFAPLTDLRKTKEFALLDPQLSILAPIESLSEALYERSVHFFIGNLDTRVSTHHACNTLLSLCEKAHKEGLKSPPLELTLYPSIGHMGHGTPPYIFETGSISMIKKLGFLNGF